jgi:N-acetylneuraminic acid mutarotase
MTSPQIQWKTVPVKSGQESTPKQRSLHAGVVIGDAFYVFGGYDGSSRLNELHKFDFTSCAWSHVAPTSGLAPSPRDRLAACASQSNMFIFGGYDGVNRVNDLWRFDTLRNAWTLLDSSSAQPSPRHSHSLCAANDRLYLLFGYDGNYRSDVWEFNPTRKTWVTVAARGAVPKPRYRSTVVAHRDTLLVFGGHETSGRFTFAESAHFHVDSSRAGDSDNFHRAIPDSDAFGVVAAAASRLTFSGAVRRQYVCVWRLFGSGPE